MDQQLKQRLIGITIVVALVVIFVPMLFDKSDDKGKLSAVGIPAIPEDVLEKPLELPKSAEDLAPKDKDKEAEKAPAETGYKIVPLNDEPPPKPKNAAQAGKAEEGDEPMGPVEDLEEAEAPAPASGADTKPAEAGKAAAKAPKMAAPLASQQEADPDAGEAPADKPPTPPANKPKPAPSQPPAHPAEAAKKPASVAHPTVKTGKPKPAARPDDADAEDDTAAPAQPAKPASHPAENGAKKNEAEPRKADKPKAKPADKPQAKAASAWVVQTGSFTEETSARGLVEKLKQSKFPAYVETVQGAHGPIYRVQVGPEQSRGRAEETLKQIGGNFGINGFLSPRH